MSEYSGERFRVPDDCPTWMKLCLGEIGLGPEFNYDDLTPEQHAMMNTLMLVYDKVKEGLIEPKIIDGELKFIRKGSPQEAQL